MEVLLWGIITHILKGLEIEEQEVDMTIDRKLDLTGKLVDVTLKKALDISHGSVLSSPDI